MFVLNGIDDPDGLLINPPRSKKYDYQWVLAPRAGDWDQVQEYDLPLPANPLGDLPYVIVDLLTIPKPPCSRGTFPRDYESNPLLCRHDLLLRNYR